MLKLIKSLEQRLANLGKSSFVNYEQYLEKHPYTNQAPSDFLISEETKEKHPDVEALLRQVDHAVTKIEGAPTGAPYHAPAPHPDQQQQNTPSPLSKK